MTDRTFNVEEHVSEQQFKDMCDARLKAILDVVVGAAMENIAKKGNPDEISDKEAAEALAELHAGQAALFAAMDHNVSMLAKQGVVSEKEASAFRSILPIMSMVIAAGIARKASGSRPDNVIPFPEGGKSKLH